MQSRQNNNDRRGANLAEQLRNLTDEIEAVKGEIAAVRADATSIDRSTVRALSDVLTGLRRVNTRLVMLTTRVEAGGDPVIVRAPTGHGSTAVELPDGTIFRPTTDPSKKPLL